MKRAVFVVFAALLVVLFYPSTHPLAKSPGYKIADGPIVTPVVIDGPPIALSDSGDSNGDDGDADDLSGFAGKGTKPVGSMFGNVTQDRVGLYLKMWWNYMIWIR